VSANTKRVAVVGCHGIGKTHAAAVAAAERVELCALCDVVEEEAKALSAETGGTPVYADLTKMLTEESPDIVTLSVPTSVHAALAVQAADAGVRGIYCEKPMASSLGEARKMLDAADRNGAVLLVNHQRRMRNDVGFMRRLADEGAVGEVQEVRASCAGDVLTDGTHAIDSLRFLTDDRPADWLIAQINHAPIVEGRPLGKGVVNVGGHRYRHGVPIESGAIASWQIADGPRAQLLTGDCRLDKPYQYYEVIGSEGRIFRPADKGDHTLFMNGPRTGGRTEPVEVPADGDEISRSYNKLVDSLETGAPHPLDGHLGFAALEIIMAVYESARLGATVSFPLAQKDYPMALMVESAR
jgi:predicted dehydrogenase